MDQIFNSEQSDNNSYQDDPLIQKIMRAKESGKEPRWLSYRNDLNKTLAGMESPIQKLDYLQEIADMGDRTEKFSALILPKLQDLYPQLQGEEKLNCANTVGWITSKEPYYSQALAIIDQEYDQAENEDIKFFALGLRLNDNRRVHDGMTQYVSNQKKLCQDWLNLLPYMTDRALHAYHVLEKGFVLNCLKPQIVDAIYENILFQEHFACGDDISKEDRDELKSYDLDPLERFNIIMFCQKFSDEELNETTIDPYGTNSDYVPKSALHDWAPLLTTAAFLSAAKYGLQETVIEIVKSFSNQSTIEDQEINNGSKYMQSFSVAFKSIVALEKFINVVDVEQHLKSDMSHIELLKDCESLDDILDNRLEYLTWATDLYAPFKYRDSFNDDTQFVDDEKQDHAETQSFIRLRDAYEKIKTIEKQEKDQSLEFKLFKEKFLSAALTGVFDLDDQYNQRLPALNEHSSVCLSNMFGYIQRETILNDFLLNHLVHADRNSGIQSYDSQKDASDLNMGTITPHDIQNGFQVQKQEVFVGRVMDTGTLIKQWVLLDIDSSPKTIGSLSLSPSLQ